MSFCYDRSMIIIGNDQLPEPESIFDDIENVNVYRCNSEIYLNS